jgi:hypothetical protein
MKRLRKKCVDCGKSVTIYKKGWNRMVRNFGHGPIAHQECDVRRRRT